MQKPPVNKAAGGKQERKKVTEGKRWRSRKKSKKEKADILEPEKCPLPREVGPFFPLLTGGENIYKTNREHISSESCDTAESKIHFCSITAATYARLPSKTLASAEEHPSLTFVSGLSEKRLAFLLLFESSCFGRNH